MYIASTNQPKQKTAPLPDTELNKTWEQEKSFKALKKFNDPRFGDISVIKNNSNVVLMAKEKLASSKGEASDDVNYLRLRSDLNHPHLQKLVAYTATTNKELCSTTYTTRAFFEFPRTDAFKELSDRQKANETFSHDELIHLTYQSLAALSLIHQRGLSHGDIRPQLIGFDKQSKHFEILDRLADPTSIERCQTNNLVNKKDIYLAPQLYKKLKGKDKGATFNAQKNDIFALGLTILYLGEGKSIQDIYTADGEVVPRKLQEHVMEFDIKCSDDNPLLCTMLKELLQFEESNRSEAGTILRNNPSYDEYKRNEAKGIVLGKQEPKPRQVQNAPPQDFTAHAEPTRDTTNFFDIDHNQTYGNNGYNSDYNNYNGNSDNNGHNYNEPNRQDNNGYNFPVGDNEDFGGYNPYMVKQSKVHNAPPQQITTHNQPQQVHYQNDFAPQVTTTTYVRSSPHQPQNYHTYAQFNQPTVTYVQSTPQYNEPVFAQSTVRYVQSNPQHLPTTNHTVVYEESKQIRRSYQNAPVEVRRGSPVPTPHDGKVIKKRYVMREDGTVVELDPNADIGADEIRKYFDTGYTKDSIANYDNVDQALKSDHH